MQAEISVVLADSIIPSISPWGRGQ
jgi:hypothetical protein